jgi:hypothetical protein
MLLGNLSTALCNCLLIVTCYVDAYKCRLPQLLFSQHCSNHNVMLHVVLAIALPRSWSVFSFRNVALNACRVVGLFRVCCRLRCYTDLPSQTCIQKAASCSWSYWKTGTNDTTLCCTRTLEGSLCRHWQRPTITSQHRHDSHISHG